MPTPLHRRAILEVVIAYAAFASIWILSSDAILAMLVRDPGHRAIAGTLKGWAFVLLTSALLYATLRRMLARFGDVPGAARWWGLSRLGVATALVVGLLSLAAAGLAYDQQKSKEVARLAAIAELKAAQVGDWLGERRANARFFKGSKLIAGLHHDWIVQGNQASRERLQRRIEDYSQIHNFAEVLVVGCDGAIRLATGEAPPALDAVALEAVALACTSDEIVVIPSQRPEGRSAGVDFLAPLRFEDTTEAVLVLRTDLDTRLLPQLQLWPEPNEQGVVALLRRDGDRVQSLGAAMMPPSALGTLLDGAEGAVAPVALHVGSGRSLHAVARRVTGTDWWLAVALDPQSLYDEPFLVAFWVGLAGFLALAVAAAAGFMLRGRNRLALAALREQEQAERLASLEVLDAIAESSTDAIFAKDLEGHYLFLSREACNVAGKSHEELLGRDDNAFFPPDQVAQVRANDEAVIRQGEVRTFEERLGPPGRQVTYLATKGPLRDRNGRTIGMFGISRDITARNRAVEELARERARLASIVETMAEGLVIIGASGCYEFANAASETILGAGRESFIGRRFDDVPWQRRNMDGTPFRQPFHPFVRIAGGEPELREFLFTIDRPDGTCIRISLNARPMRDASGAFAGMVATFIDVSARHLAEDRLRESEEKLRLFIENAPAGIAMFDREMRYLALSRRWREDYSIHEDSLVGRCHYDVFPDMPQRWKDTHARGLAGEIVRCDEDRIPLPDGGEMWLSWEVRPWHLASGAVGGIIIAAEDITARRRDREAVRKSLEHSRRLIATLTEGIAEFGKDGTALSCNAAAERLFGLGLEQIRDVKARRSIWRMVREDGSRFPDEELPLTRALATGEPQHNVLLGLHRPDGELRWAIASVEPTFDAAGAVESAVASFTDITERQKSAEELARYRLRLEELVEQRTAQLESTVSKLEAFSYTISHDLRAPLRAIIGYAAILHEEAASGMTEDARAMLLRMADAAARMNDMLEDIHAYSRADRTDTRIEEVRLADTVSEVVADLAPVYPEATLVVGELPTVRADPTMMRQVFQNLIANALKFSSRSEAPRVEVGVETLDGKATYFVRDNGAGFDMRYAHQLFGMFQRLHLVSDFPGTGVGLAIVKRIVERHGGTVSAESVPGRGSTFRFTLG